MTSSRQLLEGQLSALKPQAIDAFSRLTIDGAMHALADNANPLRLNFFSTAMRILFEHMMGRLAPIDAVKKSDWFVAERDDGIPTRGQRIAFVIQGGLADAFVQNRLGVVIAPLRKSLLIAVDDLSKHVHGREDTVVTDLKEQDAQAQLVVGALQNFLSTYHDCRSAIIDPIQEALDDAAVDVLISDTILAVDELASHHSVEEVYVDKISVEAIGPESITYRASGKLAVILQWGSNSDVRRGDGAEIDQSFPFHCTIEVSLENPWDLSAAETAYYADTSQWRDAMQPDYDNEPPL